MRKKGVIISIFLLIAVAVIVTVTLLSCGAFSTSKLEVYTFLKENKVVETSRELEADVKKVYDLNKAKNNAAELNKVNRMVALTSNVVEELTSYTLSVNNTLVKVKSLNNAYSEYAAAKNTTKSKVEEALNSEAVAVDEVFLAALLENCSNMEQKYNIFANELLIYVQKACLNEKLTTVKMGAISFIQGFNSHMVNNYLAANNLKNNSTLGISENEALYKKYVQLKAAESEILKEENIKFLDAFNSIESINTIYEKYSQGLASLSSYIANNVFSGDNAQLELVASKDIYNFLALSSWIV